MQQQKKLIYSEELSKKHNSQVYLKPEWFGETGSHKDRWAATIVGIAIKKGFDKVVTPSSGNQGLALAAQARKKSIECVIVVDQEMPKKYVPLIKQYNAKLIVTKSSRERSAIGNSFVRKRYFPCFLTLHQRKTKETEGIEAYKKISEEVVNFFNTSPDVILIPTCYGDLAKRILDGFIDLKKAKKINAIPRFILAKAKSPKGNIAFSICTNIRTMYVREVQQKTRGKTIFLENKDFIHAKSWLKKFLNVHVENSAAASIAVLDKLSKKDIKNKRIVSILTAVDR